jgi:hypothetical protein
VTPQTEDKARSDIKARCLLSKKKTHGPALGIKGGGELMGASKAAWESGDKHKAKELSEEAHKEGAKAEELSAEASQKIFEFKNSPERIHALEIDLSVRCCRRSCHFLVGAAPFRHGLQVAEALGFTKNRLERDAASGPAETPMLVRACAARSAAAARRGGGLRRPVARSVLQSSATCME